MVSPSVSEFLASLESAPPLSAAHVLETELLREVRVFPDGDSWCALRGDNLQEGEAAFGETPQEAVLSFLDQLQRRSLPDEDTPRLVRHDDLDEVLALLWDKDIWEGEETLGHFSGVDGQGNVVDVSRSDMRQTIQEMGCYAFARPQTREIHIWVSEDALSQDDLLLWLLSHELGHLYGVPSTCPFTEEWRAESYARVSELALKWKNELQGKGDSSEEGPGL